MKISTKGRYALRLMIDLAQNGQEKHVSLHDISKRQEISTKYLEQIVSSLTKAGLIRSIRGAQGGYSLIKDPKQYTAGEILRAVEGNLSCVACLETQYNLCERKESCQTLAFYEGLNKVINDYVDSVTLQDFVDRFLDHGTYVI
ncbi:RrF2 family transcriptional regulator [[Eubacterium] hominis]|uniref:RrF2 family transcriptional regulator n=1 Tax=[Eubacterium] hominis TaxID=2764325 RepID=UPI003A4D942A